MEPIAFVSVGPGNVDNVTLGCFRALCEADDIYVFSTQGISRAEQIILKLKKSLKKKIHVVEIPMKTDRAEVNQVYDRLARPLKDLSDEKRKVAVATEGDSGIFATTHYVQERLVTLQVPVRQHAGIPSFIASGAVGRLHLIKQQERLLIVPGKITMEEMSVLIEGGTNLIIMKLSMAKDLILDCMEKYADWHFHYFSSVGTDEEFYTDDKKEIRKQPFPYFSLMYISK